MDIVDVQWWNDKSTQVGDILYHIPEKGTEVTVRRDMREQNKVEANNSGKARKQKHGP